MIVRMILIGLCLLYILNPSGGIIEIPDNLPIVGNLDEAGITALMIKLIADLRELRKRKSDSSQSDSKTR